MVRIPKYDTRKLDIRDIEVLHRIKEFFKLGSVIVRIRDGKSTGIYCSIS